MDIVFILPPVFLVVLTGAIILANKIDPEDPAPYVVFGLLPIAAVTMLVTLCLFQPYDSNCRKVTEIGGCNRYGCGVKTSTGTIESMSQPVLGQQICDKKFQFRF
jgi:hypothetical protein